VNLFDDVEEDIELTTLTALEVTVWRESDTQLILPDCLGTGLNDLETKSSPVLDRPAVFVGPLVAGFLEELVDEVSV
jgi:hypothetical protein